MENDNSPLYFHNSSSLNTPSKSILKSKSKYAKPSSLHGGKRVSLTISDRNTSNSNGSSSSSSASNDSSISSSQKGHLHQQLLLILLLHPL